MEVLRRVFILGGIAATDVATAQAQPEMHPLVTGFQTLFAAVRVRNDLLDLGEMCTLAHNSNVPIFSHGLNGFNGLKSV